MIELYHIIAVSYVILPGVTGIIKTILFVNRTINRQTGDTDEQVHALRRQTDKRTDKQTDKRTPSNPCDIQHINYTETFFSEIFHEPINYLVTCGMPS